MSCQYFSLYVFDKLRKICLSRYVKLVSDNEIDILTMKCDYDLGARLFYDEIITWYFNHLNTFESFGVFFCFLPLN
jgi:hypothetical protein